MSKRGPFDFIDDLGYKKTDLSKEGLQGFSTWITNRHFAKFVDTIMHANQMNIFHGLDEQMQHDYYLHSLRARKRFSPKKSVDTTRIDAVDALVKRYGINKKKALAAAAVLKIEDLHGIISGEQSIEQEGRNVGGTPRKS